MQIRTTPFIAIGAMAASMLTLLGPPAHAAGETWQVTEVANPGCGGMNLQTEFQGLRDVEYTFGTHVTSGGLVYMDEFFTGGESNGPVTWGIYRDFSNGPVENPGEWPIPEGQEVRIVLSLGEPDVEEPLHQWTTVLDSCDTGTVLYNGLTSADLDQDLVPTPTDLCPLVPGRDEADGCPVQKRTLTLKQSRKGLKGHLRTRHHTALTAGERVRIFRVQPGPDLKVASRRTNATGRFMVTLRRSGRYYAVAPAALDVDHGKAPALTSPRIRIRIR